MNDEPPSPLPPSAPMPPTEPSSPPPFWAMFFLGIGVLVLSGFACVGLGSPVPLLIGAVTAFVSSFFRGWRGIGAGYLATIGLIILAVIVVCGTGLVPPFHE